MRKADTSVVDKPSTSADTEPQKSPQYTSIEDFTRQLESKNIEPWQIERSHENEVRVELNDRIHDSIPKYTVVINSSLEFTIFANNWPVEFLQRIEHSRLCEGLKQDDDWEP